MPSPIVFCLLLGLYGCALTYGDPEIPIEPCPEDSVNFEGSCRCDHTLCEKPMCNYTLQQLTNATETPGACCPTYACEGCPEEALISGLCPCLPGAAILSGRKCECVDPHEVLVDGRCTCEPNRCELPALCDERSVQVKRQEGCCDKVQCIQCLEDSYPTNFNDPQLEDKCVCFSCSKTECPAGRRVRILRRGRNVPGMCCDIYECEGQAPEGCAVNGTLYSEGETWIPEGSADRCRCQKGIFFCSPIEGNGFRQCLSSGKVYNHLDSWVEDICTNCTCKDGEPKCIAHMCDVQTTELKKPGCPPLTGCKKYCEHGFRLNKHGCEVCKCKLIPPEKKAPEGLRDKIEAKESRLDVLLKEYNLTEGDVVSMVEGLAKGRMEEAEKSGGASTSTSSTTSTTSAPAPSTTVCITDNKKSCGVCGYRCILEYGFSGFAAGAILGGVAMFLLLKCSEKNRQKYKMAYTYKPVGKDAVDKNLNFSPIIKTKNFELQSYNEKKNVI